jgi:hypothetical protein
MTPGSLRLADTELSAEAGESAAAQDSHLEWVPSAARFDGQLVHTSVPRSPKEIWSDRLRLRRWHVKGYKRVTIAFSADGKVITSKP